MSSSPFLPFAVGVFSALIGVVLGLLAQTFWALRSMDIAAINDHIAHLTEIEKLAVDYWLNEGTATFQVEQVAAARLRGTLDASGVFAEDAERLFGLNYPAFWKLDGQLFDLATGGSFEQPMRASEPVLALSVMQVCAELRALLRQQRRKMYWSH